MTAPAPDVEAWAARGPMALTGRPDGPGLVAPDAVLARIAELGSALDVDPVALLAHRAAAAGLGRGGDRSAGGAARLLRAADGWVAVDLPRDEDLAAVGAWLEVDPGETDPWEAVEAHVPGRATAELVGRAALLGLPVSGAAEVGPPASDRPLGGLPLRAAALGPGGAVEDPPLVVDLSSLWAGPLCTRLLADRGLRVVKVESRSRPDGARWGPPAFFDLLHHGKEALSVELGTSEGVEQLRHLLRVADVVVESSRARALQQLGILAEALLSEQRGPRVWVSITGHGRGSDRVAFGDDAAVAGGLLAADARGPVFVADAAADPLAGIAAASAVVRALERGGSWLLDVSMAGVAAHVAAGTRPDEWYAANHLDAAEPVAPAPPGPGPALGADDATAPERFGLDLR